MEAWAGRAADRSPAVQRSRDRSVRQAKLIVDGARRLIELKGVFFTTQELVDEAGVALQTFYRHFASKDQLLLAVFEEEIAQQVAGIRADGLTLPDPVQRLRFYITAALRVFHDTTPSDAAIAASRFVTAEHWRLYQLFPDDVERANQPFADLIEDAVREATAVGLLRAADPAQSAWLVMKLVMSVFHHFAFAASYTGVDEVTDHLWTFCRNAFGGASEEL